MADENINIVVSDKVSSSVSTKLKGIAADAREAGNAVKLLQTQLASLSSASGLQKLQTQLANTASQQQRLSSVLQQTATATLQAQTAQTQLATAQNNSATAAQRLATAQAQTATATANAAAAQTRAATATTRSQTATQALAAATARTNTAQTQGMTAAQRLATEQQRTAVQTANAAAASDRAALAALRLQQAQNKQAQSSKTAGQALAQYARSAAALVGGGLTASAIIGQADAYTTLQNKLQNVTETQAQVNRLTDELFRLADRTRSGVQETATAFTRFDRALKFMGKSQEDSLRLTETINKALIVSGATAQEASSALLQLSQGFNAGKLQGDEFRAVAENMPIALDAVAKALNVPINRVKQLSSDGKITSEVLYKAFTLIQKSVDDTFAKTTPTIGQSLTVLKNNSIQFFGELNKATGFTTALSKAILFLARNMDVLAAIVAVVGSAMLVYFGSSLVAAITTATRAVLAFTLAIAANPIGLLIVGITAATVAIAAFGDKIKVTEDGLVSLKDVALSVWSYIKEGASTAGSYISSVWGTAVDWINEKTNGWGEQFRDVGNLVLTRAKTVANYFIGFWVGSYAAIKAAWNAFPQLMQGFFAAVVNSGAAAIEMIVNSWQIGLRLVAKAAEAVAPEMAKNLNASLDAITLKIPRMDTSSGEIAAAEVGKAFSDAFNKDYVGDAANAVMNRARTIAEQRRLAAAQEANTKLRGQGANQLGGEEDKNAAKAAERRALALEKINTQLDNELNRMGMLQPQREAQAKMDQIEESLIQKKIKLTKDEKSSIMGKIKAIQDATVVQQKMDELYNEAIAPQRDYNASLTAAQQLLGQGAISQEQYSRAIVKANEAFLNAQDPMRQYNKDLQQQYDLLNMLPKQREIEQQVMQVQNDLLAKGINLTQAELTQLRERLKLIQQTTAVMQQYDKIYSETTGRSQELTDQQTALNKAFSDGLLTLDSYTSRLVQLGIEAANFRLKMGDASFDDVLTASLGRMVEGYQNATTSITNMMGDFFTTFTDGFANSIGQAVVQAEDLKSALYAVAQQAVSGLISALVKLGIQWLVNAALGNSLAATAMATQTAMSVAAGTATAAAWAPAAAMVSLATFGANSAGAMAGIAATNAMTQAMSVASMIGFEKGGYTGSGGVKEIAGLVHGQEFVMNAAATKRIGVDNLQALQNGASTLQGEQTIGSGGDTKLNVTIIDQSTAGSVDYEVRQLSERDVEIIAKRVVAKDTDQYVASSLANPNSKGSRALAKNTSTERRF